MTDKPFGPDEISKGHREFALRDKLDKLTWLSDAESRNNEIEASKKGTATVSQILQNKLSELEIIGRTIDQHKKQGIDTTWQDSIYSSSVEDLKKDAASTTPEFIASQMMRVNAEALEKKANKHGISFFSGTGSLEEEQK